MNLPEKIVGAYLRLNGFFLMPHFTVFNQQTHSHIDYLGLRHHNSQEGFETNEGFIELPLDEVLFDTISERIGRSFNEVSLGVIVEVKGNNEIEIPSDEHKEYAARVLGDEAQLFSISFSNRISDIREQEDTLIIGIKYALDWIFERFRWMDENISRLTKTGSWSLSEDALSDLIYLYKIQQDDE
jgi:hypothetical protein